MVVSLVLGVAFAFSAELGKGLTVTLDSKLKEGWKPFSEDGANVVMELETRYTSTGTEGDKKIPLADTVTLQTQRIEGIKASGGEGVVVFSQFQVSADAFLPGSTRPFQQQFRLDDELSKLPLKFRKKQKSLELISFASWMKSVEQSIRNPLAKRSFNTAFTEQNVIALISEESRRPLCWQQGVASTKKPGEKWLVEEDSQGFRFKQNCEFRGWGKGNDGAQLGWVVYTVSTSETIKKQPNGVDGRVRISGGGNLWIDRAKRQWFDHKKLQIEALPMESEIRQLKAKGKPVPGNLTLMETAMRISVSAPATEP